MRAARSPLYVLTALLMGSLAAQAQTAPSEWRCQPAADGQGWACGLHELPSGPYRLPALPERSAAVGPDATRPVTPASPTPASVPAQAETRLADSAAPETPPTSSARREAPLRPVQELPPAQLDWSPRADIPAEQWLAQGNGHCAGLYLDPLADVDRAALNPETADFQVTADSGLMQEAEDRFVLEGNVAFQQGYRQGGADSATLERDNNRLYLDGNVKLREPGLLIRADHATLDRDSGRASADGVHFVAHEEHARGTAARLTRESEGVYTLQGSRYTTCEPGSNTWSIGSGKLHLDQNTGIGRASHTVLRLKNVPVAYLPYIEFPIDDRRKTGFLWPSFSNSNRGGIDIATPYYLNLAPNYDATITPRYIQKRGAMLETQFRHLNPLGHWTVNMAYLGNDDQYVEDRSEFNVERKQRLGLPVTASDYDVDKERWLFGLEQSGSFARGWRTRIDYTRVSDEEFLRDLDPVSLDIRRQGHLDQRAEISYSGNQWQFLAELQHYQTILHDTNEPYAQLPHLELLRHGSGEAFRPDWTLTTDYSFFAHDQRIRGQRLYVAPSLVFPMRWQAGFLEPTLTLRHLSYALAGSNANNIGDPNAILPPAGTQITGSTSVTSPAFSLDAGLIFERDFEHNGNAWQQTLEPRLFYRYADYENQDHLPNFDTNNVDFSYYQLFRDSRFNSYDRLDDTEQLTVSLASRFIDNDSGREVLSLGIGQIFYFRDLRVSARSGVPYTTEPHSEIVAQALFTPSDTFQVLSNISWHPGTNKTSEGGILGQWQLANNTLFNLGYRYRREGESWDPMTATWYNANIHQVETSAVLPISERWRLFGKLHYDINNHESLETLAGVEYESCCWMLRLVYQESLDSLWSRNTAINIPDWQRERDYAFHVQFQLKGLGDLSDNLDRLLEKAIQGFDRLGGNRR